MQPVQPCQASNILASAIRWCTSGTNTFGGLPSERKLMSWPGPKERIGRESSLGERGGYT